MRASVIVLCFNGLEEATRPCVESLYRNTPRSEFELVLVDNASSDGTPEYLRQLERTYDNVRIQLNDTNKGFAGGNNDGLRLAQGDYLVLLNNDTLVPPGWLNRLLHLLETNPNLGLVGPVTNSAGNEQRVELPGLNEANFEEVAERYTERHRDVWFPTEKLGFFCVAMRKDLPQRVGYLDERFGIGMFEDDDYCLRVRRDLGYTLAVTEGCFVYHKGSVSFEKLDVVTYRGLFDWNRLHFQSKHRVPWAFTDIALSYWEKFNRDLSAYAQIRSADPTIERILVRFQNFRHLLLQVYQAEMARQGSEQSASSGLMRHHRWGARWRRVKLELLLGSNSQRLRFLKHVSRRLIQAAFPRGTPSYGSAISQLANIRTGSQFERAVIFPATIDFHYLIQRPQQLARSFAKQGFLVIYGTLNHSRDKVEVIERIEPNLYLVNEKWFAFLHDVLKPEETIYFCLWPNNIKHLNYLPYQFVVYDWMDDLSLLELSREDVERHHAEMLERADLITVSSDKLYRAVPERYHQKTVLLNNAVSEDFIRSVQKPTPDPEELQTVGNRRILGYYGAIAKWLDFDLVETVASTLADCVVMLVGPVIGVHDKLNALLRRHPNVLHLGERPQNELIPFLQRFDVCLIPFLKNEITDAISPVKLFEYLAAGKPVVTTDLAECRKYEVISVARSQAEFVAMVKDGLTVHAQAEETKRLTVARSNTWEERVRVLYKELNALSHGAIKA